MAGVPAPSPASDAFNYADDYAFNLVFFEVIPWFLLVLLTAAQIYLQCCKGLHEQEEEATDLEAGNPNNNQRRQQQLRLPVNIGQQLPVNIGQRPPCTPFMQAPRAAQRPEDPNRIAEISRGCKECVFCLGEFSSDAIGVVRETLTPCGHRFHKTCIDKWLKAGHGCPVCRGVPGIFSTSMREKCPSNVG